MQHPTLRIKHASLALRRAIDTAVAPMGLTAAQFDVVQELLHHDGMKHRELQRKLSIASPTLTNILDRMEAAELIERHPDPLDARVRRVYLAKATRGLCKTDQFLNAGRELIEQMFNGVNDSDRELFLAVADRITANLQRE